MTKATLIKREMRFQQWVQQVKEFNARPEGMSRNKWCKLNGISESTFSTRLHKVQERCLEESQISLPADNIPVTTAISEPIVQTPTTFAEIPTSYQNAPAEITAVILCNNFKIELFESISEDFLFKLIGAIRHV